MPLFQHAVQLPHGEGGECAGEARRRPRGEYQLGRIGEQAVATPPRVETDGKAMFGLHHLWWAVQVQALRMAFEIRDGDEQVQRVPLGQQRRPALCRFHRVEGVQHHAGEDFAAKGRFEPSGADEV